MVKVDQVWDRTVEFLGDHLSAVAPIAVIGIFVPSTIVNIVTPLWASPERDLQLVLWLMTLAAFVALCWASLAIAALVLDPPARSRVAGVAARRLLPLIGVYMVLIAGFTALAVPIGAMAGMAGMDMAAVQAGRATRMTSPAMGWALALYTLAFLIVVLVILARLIPLSAVIVAERRGIGAITRTWRLTRGMTWRLIGVAILYFVVSQVAGLAARTVFGSILRFVSPGDGPLTVGNIITAIIVAAVSTGFTVLAAVFAAKLYMAVLSAIEPVAAYASNDRVESNGTPL